MHLIDIDTGLKALDEIMTTATATVGGIVVSMEGAALGVSGRAGERTVVRRAVDGRFVVMTASKPYSLIRVFADVLHARRYNMAIHGESL